MDERLDSQTIRSLVRQVLSEVLAEELPRLKAARAARKPDQAARLTDQKVEWVEIKSDAELTAFANRVMALAKDPKAARDIAQGRLTFRLGGASPQAGAVPVASAIPATTTSGGVEKIERGLLSERQIDALDSSVKRLLVGKSVRFTPLAQDRLRQKGIKIERMET